MQKIRVEEGPEGDEAPFAPIDRFLDHQFQKTKATQSLYQKGPLSLLTFVSIMGGPVFRAIEYLSSRPGTKIRCCECTEEDLSNASSSLRTSNTLVLDETAVATIFLLGIQEQVLTLPLTYVVSEGTLAAIRGWRHRVGEQLRGGHSVAKVDGKRIGIPNSPEQAKRDMNKIDDLLGLIAAKVKLEGGEALATIDRKERDELIKLFGQPCAESMVLARQSGRVYWTDDLYAGEIAKASLQVNRVWTQTVVRWLVDTGRLESRLLDDVTIGLVERQYSYTIMLPGAITGAVCKSNWDVDEAPLRQVLDWFGNWGATPSALLALLSSAIVWIWRQAPIVQRAEAITTRILERLASRPSGYVVIASLERIAGYLFGLDVVNAQRFVGLIREFRRTHSGAGGAPTIEIP